MFLNQNIQTNIVPWDISRKNNIAQVSPDLEEVSMATVPELKERRVTRVRWDRREKRARFIAEKIKMWERTFLNNNFYVLNESCECQLVWIDEMIDVYRIII
jgi:hypothetical protein